MYMGTYISISCMAIFTSSIGFKIYLKKSVRYIKPLTFFLLYVGRRSDEGVAFCCLYPQENESLFTLGTSQSVPLIAATKGF